MEDAVRERCDAMHWAAGLQDCNHQRRGQMDKSPEKSAWLKQGERAKGRSGADDVPDAHAKKG